MQQPAAPEPAPEHHDEVDNAHQAVWVVTGCGVDSHPTWWSCAVCLVPAGEPLPSTGP